jgi:hypothetical protein
MARSSSLVFLCLAAFLVLSPLVLHKPGWPVDLKADEPAYYLMALSLALDGDLRCELHDLRRIFDEFPFVETQNLILATDDGWNTVYFGKPYVYSLFAAPAAGLFGASGIVAFNALLMAGMIWLGACYLRRYNPDSVAMLFAAGFFLLSVGFSYVFWIQPEVFNMAAVTACLYLGLTDGERRWRTGWGRLLSGPLARTFGSGAALALAAYNKPMLALLGLPVLYRLLRRGRRRALVGWIAGGAVCLALTAGLAVALTGHPSAYLGMTRGGQKVCTPDEMPIRPDAVPAAEEPYREPAEDETAAPDGDAELTHAPPAGSWWWMFRIPRFHPREVLENVEYFLWGRHTGLFLYFPFTLLAGGLFLVHGRRSAVRWLVLGSLVAVAAVFLLWIPYNWQGGGGFVGNRYYVNAYPGFLFLVTRVAPAGVNLLGYVLGGLLLGPTLLSPMGRMLPWPTLQAHVRNFPFQYFPFELSLREVPGYDKRSLAGVQFLGRRDVYLARGPVIWTQGATETEIWLQSVEPLERLVFHVRSLAAPNEIVLRLGSTTERLVFEHGHTAEHQQTSEPGRTSPTRAVELDAGKPTRLRSARGTPVYAYRLLVRAATGEVRVWTKHIPPRDCLYFPYNEIREEPFYVGAELSFLGPAARIEKDLYEVEWGDVEVPPRVTAGSVFTVTARMTNKSGESWPADPPTRVGLAYRWQDAAGRLVVKESERTYFDMAVAPGTTMTAVREVMAPAAPGTYVLTLDLVYELVAWFSDKNGDDIYRATVEVVPADPG